MCGIAGIIGKPAAEAEKSVNAMLDTITYRGPNDRGLFADGRTVLGHLRLSIIDVSSAGHQPMTSHDGRYRVIFNGEIFNYIELRDELKSLGCVFTTQSDTEVILEAYRQWGEQCVSHFNGMWAFALWDAREQSLFCSRDRFGVKPFFYTWNDGVFSFASEMKALLNDGKGEPDYSYLYRFFDRKTPLGSDRTVFRGIHHLRPAHSIVLKNGALRIVRYWRPDPHRQTHDGDSVEAFRALLLDSVRLRLRSDVPLGVCLSGGIDSSVIAVAIKSFGITPETFSSIYQEAAYSEKEFIDTVNQSIGAVPHSITPQSDDFFAVLENIVRHHDEPVRMPGVFSHWHVMQCASGHVTVLLDGQGADEILGGYREYYPAYLASLLRDELSLRKPAEARAYIRSCLAGLRDNMGESNSFVREALLKTLPVSLRQAFSRKHEKDELFTQAFRDRHSEVLRDDPQETAFLKQFPSVLDRDMYRHFVETNLPMLLRYEDRNSMAFSLEARVPFLDYRVVEFCQSLNYRDKIRGYTTKWILREAFKDLLPPRIYQRKDKKGFPTPAAVWFRGPLQEEVRQRLDRSCLIDAGLVESSVVSRMVNEHMDGTRNHERTLFRLLTLDLWMNRYVR